jgi:hypothetical protein
LQRLAWSRGPRTRSRRAGAVLGLGLVAANAIALGLWLYPVKSARIDLTQDGTYSLSEPTERILAGLDEPLLIRGYFSEKTHPKLAPLVPQIRDLLEEIRIHGHGKVRVEFVDPSDSDDAKREAKERFGIDPTPLRFATQVEKSVVNAYFNIAIEYGDQHAVLGLDDLISVRVVDVGPVIGGYLAALLLSAAYLAIGMCVSASTDNQIVAFVGTALACSVAYAIAETGAMQLALIDAEDHERAMEIYLKLCRIGGTMSVLDIFASASLRSPFDPDLMRDLMRHAAKELDVKEEVTT